MASMEKVFEGKLTAKDRKFAIVVSRFNELITRKLLEGALDSLYRHYANPGDIDIAWVPGSFEIPVTAQKLAGSGKYNAVICIGSVIRSETPHFEFVAAEVAKGVAQVGLQTGVPTIFGVLTTDNVEQAVERAGAPSGNRGTDAAMAAMEMADLFGRLG